MKLVKLSALILFVLFATGCNTLKHLVSPESHPNTDHGPGDDYTVSGTTAIDYEVIQPVRCVDSSVTARVKVPGGEWRDLNKYEFKCHLEGTGGGGVEFKRECQATFNANGDPTSLYFTGKPAAPKGTLYEIRSIKTSGMSHQLY